MNSQRFRQHLKSQKDLGKYSKYIDYELIHSNKSINFIKISHAKL